MRNGILKSKYQAIARAMTRNFSVNVVFDGGGARTDGVRTIYLPANADELPNHDQQSLDGWCDHEGCHVEEEITAEREGHTSPMAIMNGEAKARGPKYQLMLNVYEDIRIERRKSATHPGVAENLQLINERSIRSYREGKVQDPWQSIAGAIIATGRGLDTSWISGGVATVMQLIAPELADIPSMEKPADAWDLAVRTVDKIKELAEEAQQEQQQREEAEPEADDDEDEPEDQEGEESDGEPEEDGDDTDADEHTGGEESDDGGEEDGEGQGDSDTDDDGEEQGQSGSECDEEAEGEEDEGDAQGDADGAEDDSEAPEGDDTGDAEGEAGDDASEGEPESVSDLDDGELSEMVEALVDVDDDPECTDMIEYTKGEINIAASNEAYENNRIIPTPYAAQHDGFVEPRPGNLTQYEAAKAEVNEQIGTLRRKLATMLRARQQVHFQGDKEDGALDTASLHSIKTGNRRVFAQQTVAEANNTSITLLIDLSGSMGECDTQRDSKGEPSKRQDRAWYAQRAAVALAETLEAIGVPFEVLGFYSTGGPSHTGCNRVGPFQIVPFKLFNEKLRRTRARFSDMSGRGANGDGDAVMFAAKRLATRPEARRILIVISDGQPAGPAPGHLLRADLNRVISEVTKSGIEVFGIGANNGAVRDYYNPRNGAASVVINNLDKLAPSIFKLIRSKLTRRRRAA